MKSLLDWVLDRLRLIDDETQNQFEPVKAEPGEDSFEWHRKREGTRGDAQIFYKVIQRYDDCRIVLDKYQDGMICIFCLDPGEDQDSQGMMNYLCGGMYILDGKILNVSGNVFIMS
ncbi:MAG: cell division protein SepF [Lachnospiraceae bacterium]|nr:cell division protein SepF [Lachnospiraceae bacterium]